MQAIIGNYAVPILEERQVWGTSDETRTAYLDSTVCTSFVSLWHTSIPTSLDFSRFLVKWAKAVLEERQVWGTSAQTRTAYLDSTVCNSCMSLIMQDLLCTMLLASVFQKPCENSR